MRRSERRRRERDALVRAEAEREHGRYAAARLAGDAGWCYLRLGVEELSDAERVELLARAELFARVAHGIASGAAAAGGPDG